MRYLYIFLYVRYLYISIIYKIFFSETLISDVLNLIVLHASFMKYRNARLTEKLGKKRYNGSVDLFLYLLLYLPLITIY